MPNTVFLPPHGADSPLSYAVTERQRDVLEIVQEAVAKRRVSLAFQPVMQTSDAGRPAFWEGLIRIEDANGRIIPPDDFIHLAENYELGRQIDTIAMELGMNALCEHPEIRLSINMSARSIAYPRWHAALHQGLDEEATAGERLILEITESSAMTMPEIVHYFMNDMHHFGVSFALDNFGAGFHAPRHLRQLFFDVMKIDRQFTHNIHLDTDNQVLVQAFISVAHHFEAFTVAENVENAEDAEMLAEIGIDCMQGFYFAAPTRHPNWAMFSQARAAS
ncbi:EAL domain-containing protein [Pseudoruegeria sp. HB172150]|uniref:EAL domain-containing protein n=1 Tax=Pseudoruegeria sp. HB172150 TaxID=2721164 RepID=UPI0015562D47|nr:EAL domain-containing protein [Pseudoruegeria sp. HB172150]